MDMDRLLLGPGERLARLAVHLRLVLEVPEEAEITQLDSAIAVGYCEDGVALIEAEDLLPGAEAILESFLDGEDSRLVLVGTDPTLPAVRNLLLHPRVNWLAWPADLEQIEWLADLLVECGLSDGELEVEERLDELPLPEPPLPGASLAGAPLTEAPGEPTLPSAEPSGPQPPPERRDARELRLVQGGDDLARIEAILSTPPGQSPFDEERDLPPLDDELDDDFGDDFDEDDEELGGPVFEDAEFAEEEARAFAPPPPPAPRAAGTAERDTPPPPYFKDQVADLADIAQRLELRWRALREEAGDEEVEGVGDEIARLMQFTRTLSYVAAPPAAGEQAFDLARLIEELATGLSTRHPEGGRFLFRSTGRLPVRSDKALLTHAFDALLVLAQACTEEDERVRVSTERDGDRACVSIEFPPGPLRGFSLARVLEPYALRERVPELGPNALSAARGIFVGQSGELALSVVPSGRLVFRAVLPCTEGVPEPAVGPPPAGGADDPFA